MQFSVRDSATDSHPTDLPALPSYKELLEVRQKRLEQRNKSAGALSMLGTLEKSASMPKLVQMKPKYQPPAMIRKLKYDFGSLGEFLSYDLKLKRPEDLFKMTDKEKKVEVKSKEEDLKKGLMQHMRQEMDTRNPKTILLEEKDPEKISKAAKKFVGDIVNDIFHDDLNVLERKMAQKGVSKLYELLMDLDDDDPVRKIVEKYGYKTLSDKFHILEAEMDKKPQVINKKARNAGLPNKMVLQRMGSGAQNDPASNSPDNNAPKQQSAQKLLVPLLPMSQNQTHRLRQNSIDMAGKRGDRPYVFVDEDVAAFVPQRGNQAASPKVKRREADNTERMTYAIRLIKDSDSLAHMYIEYEKGDKEQFAKELQQAAENGKHNYKDFYTMKDTDKAAVVTKNHIVFTYSQLKPNFFMHMLFQVPNFSSLWVLNLRGSKLPENIVWLMLKMLEKYSPDVRMIDISENQVSTRICEVVKDILIKCEVKVLKMAGMGMRSKGLAVVCLGLAENASITDLDFNYNDIDEYGFKTLALILRHSRTLQTVKILRKKKKVTSNTGDEKEVEEELGYHAMAALTKAFKHNKYLNPKNVLLFEPKAA